MKKRGRISEQPNGIAEVVAHACVIAIHINDEYKRKMARIFDETKIKECASCGMYDTYYTTCGWCEKAYCHDTSCEGGGFCPYGHRGSYDTKPTCLHCTPEQKNCPVCSVYLKLRVVKKNNV